jgi:hypothetical protein
MFAVFYRYAVKPDPNRHVMRAWREIDESD